MPSSARSTNEIQRSTYRRFAAVITAGALIAAFITVPSAAYAEVADPADPVVFGDVGLEACVAATLGSVAGAPISQTDLSALTMLDCQMAGISDLSALQFATNLTVLNLAGNAIADATALSGLTKLTEVVLTDQVLLLPEAAAGQAFELPAVKDLLGQAVAVSVSGESGSAGTVTDNVATWSCAGAGRLDWFASVSFGGTTSTTFSGSMLQEVTPGAIPACTLAATPTPLITGAPRGGQTLTASLGAWAPAPVNLTTQWRRAGMAIPGATSATYVVLATDVGKAITVTVTGSKLGYATTARTSAAMTIEKNLTASPTPTISGIGRVSKVLTAAPGLWTPTIVTLAYRWKRNGVLISGATSGTYKLVAADAGSKVTVVVTGQKTGYTAVSRTSAAVSIEKLLTATPVPLISGTGAVGRVLTAKPGIWSPATVTLTYRWRRDGAAIYGATAPTYTLVTADAGRKITVTVVGSKSGYTMTSRTSAAKSVERLLTYTPTPTVSGVAATGRKLTANAGTWGPSPVTLTYQWRRNDVAIPGATASTYSPSGPDIGKRISVVVRGSKLGYTPKSRVSAQTAAIVLTIAIRGDGIYRMGSGLSAGTYVTRGATDGCYWARLSGFDDTLDSVITNDFGSGQRIVTISSSDAGFESSYCGSWIRLRDKVMTVRTTIPDSGIFSVAHQIKPGLYWAPGGDGCYWAGLSSFYGGLDPIIDNDFSYYTGQYVRISDWVVGFEVSGCGTWTRIGN